MSVIEKAADCTGKTLGQFFNDELREAATNIVKKESEPPARPEDLVTDLVEKLKAELKDSQATELQSIREAIERRPTTLRGWLLKKNATTMYIAAVNKRFERVIQRSFIKPLSLRDYERNDNQFYLKSGRIGKLLTIQRDPELTQHGQIVIFTLHVHITSDDFWELHYPDKPYPTSHSFRFQGSYPYYVLHRHLGLFYGKLRGSQWLALDATVPEQTMITFLRDLLSTRVLPYLDRINSLDDILNELAGPSVHRMQMLAWLGRRDEAYVEFTKLIASRHQKGFRISIVNFAKRIGVIE